MTQRASLSDYRNVNGVIIGTASDGTIVLMVPDLALLTLLLEDPGEVKIEPFDRTEPETADYLPWFDYGRQLDEGWLPIDPDLFYEGMTVTITLGEDSSPTFISKNSLPIKLKKAEFDGISYRVFPSDRVLAVSKKFLALPDYGFSLIKLFQII